METKKYLVKLTPHDKFFFGGENTFGDGHQANYLVKSNYFPQQTGVLGFVRHQLLLQCGDNKIFEYNKIKSKKKAAELIGKKSFDVNGQFNFGVIKSLSPVFIAKGDEYYLPANKEYQIFTKTEDDNSEKRENIFLEIEQKNNLFLLKGYNPKFPIPDLLMSKSGTKHKYEDVFIAHKQTGIRKNYQGGTDDEAYYVQTFYKFKKGFSFAFIVELSEKYDTNKTVVFNSQDIVIFGGEQQSFKMEVQQFKDNFETIIPDYEPSKNFSKLVLVSDAFAEKDITDTCAFAITETVDFRFIKTVTEENENYYKKPKKSLKFNLYKKGSVFYGSKDQLKSIEKELTKKENFRKSGYNHYKIINQK